MSDLGRPGLAWVRDGEGWLAFGEPVGIVVAGEVGEVREVLGEVERRVGEGLWAVGFVAYEAAPAFDAALRTRGASADGPPAAFFALHREPRRRRALDAVSGYAASAYEVGDWRASTDRRRYRAAVEEVRRRIALGDTYQVNYTYRLGARFTGDPRGLFADLVGGQGGEVAIYVDAGRHAVCCASPELFFELADGVVTTRPMKGTAARGRFPEEDHRARERLVGSEKERAENLMIVDMMRNDLGRVAEPGSVEVPELFTAERYPTLWQMTSTVTARTAASPAEVFAALFPCASITGAPKAATSAIIAELETEPRGVYTGAVGYFAPGRRARFAVAIRTAVADRHRQRVEYGVGGGIVWDSEPELEAVETEVKARVLRAPPARDFDLLETVLWTPGEGFYLLDRHLERLAGSAGYFGFTLDPGLVRRRLEEAVAGADGALRVRLLVARDGGARVETAPLAAGELGAGGADAAAALPAVPVILAEEPVDATDVSLFHKTTRRGVYDRALAAARRRCPEAGEVLLWNRAGRLTEAATANLVVELDGERLTPPVEDGLLAGVFRGHLLAAGAVAERPVAVADLHRASGLWLVNSLRRWRRARLLGASAGAAAVNPPGT